ncbi:ImmA/IrrE family metallo-endopeptidase [Anabaena sp. FACHB-709]|uniref:Transcriptional regulator n=2 Tax=Nostocaceae TaxID=1162 RepID=A0A1Z4KP26_ANAVA|nr:MULTISPECIES: XRE family transcriptional regulator [Nostocaceae]BAY70729.1 transcriptional regulator [Trichormus variabilis NIES-23]HBW31399.1 ImmA/IrrE family metallo-endopeptidase [Nostoc sp. UBA8866]MBD2172697.1 ImmA/IrrE family metallo-endopeptidase [Anabaena cylindrica FACHB-318]MBD2264333.1 ImmA/IrrE family metallo-endopeptidase [Anabaena sp. FACHB-709]MBD2276438.1 ImmA/IrrE family metallo-endopeptidase [Nostoc sp. PCC 7120 = FACHB-418]
MATNILDNINLGTLGELLQQARKKCSMTQADAAKVIDAARTTMIAIEKGERRIKPNELIKLARAYGCSVSDFVRPRPVVQPFEVQFRAVYQRSEEEEAEIKPFILKLEELCQNYLELEQIMDAPLPQNYPLEYQVKNMPIKSAAESLAIAERQRLGLGDAPIPKLRDILEQDVGLRIFYLQMPQKYSEVYSYNEQIGGCMAINAHHPEERRRWSMAHGYLHFLAHRRKPEFHFDNQYQRMPESEQLAETFPKYFLMPTSGLLKRFNDMYRTHGKFTPTNLFTLAHYYGVSVEALVYRLEEIELLPTGTWEKLRDRGLKVRKVQQELGLEDIPQRVDMMPLHYQHLAIEALDQGLITEGRFADFLCVDRLEARRIAEALREYSSGMMEEAPDFDLRQIQAGGK